MHRLLNQAQRAAAGQAETGSFVFGDAVSNHCWFCYFINSFLGDKYAGYRRILSLFEGFFRAGNQIVFNAAAGDGAADHAVVPHSQQSARRPRRATPGFYHRDQGDGMFSASPRQHIVKYS
jgi:hypothetical protein